MRRRARRGGRGAMRGLLAVIPGSLGVLAACRAPEPTTSASAPAAAPDLRGKTIAASGPRAASERAIIDVLEPYGMEMSRDYQVTYVGSQGGRLAALQQGIVDATIIAPPLGLKAREAGYRELVDLIKLGIPFGHFVITGSDAWLRANADTVR